MRSSVVLPDPDGPRSATSAPDGMTRLTGFSAVVAPNSLAMSSISICMGRFLSQRRWCAASWSANRHSRNDLSASVTSPSAASSAASEKAATERYSL